MDLNSPTVQATILAMLPLPEDEGEAEGGAGDKENAGGQAAGGEEARSGGGAALPRVAWPVGQVRVVGLTTWA